MTEIMKEKTYNGWSNYETWCVNLWLGNDQGSCDYLTEIATDKKLDKWQKAENLKSWVNEINPLQDASLFSDLLNGALSEVDWLEIIENHEADND